MRVGKRKPFTEEQVESTKCIDIVNYDISQGFEVENPDRNQKSYHIKGFGGLHIFKNGGFHCFSDSTSGSNIDFAMRYQGFNFVDAVANLTGIAPFSNYNKGYDKKVYVPKKATTEIIQTEKPDIVLPKVDNSISETVEYLVGVRGLDKDIVNNLIAKGDIYQAVTEKGIYKFKNCAFVGYDEDRKPKCCSVRSLAVGSKFRQEWTNSDKSYGFAMKGNSNRLFVFESQIDAISHASLRKLNGINYKNDSRISVGGLNDKAVNRFLENNKNIEEIIFCFDNDNDKEVNVGQEFAKKCYDKYTEKGYVAYVEIPHNKDFNEDLLQVKEILLQREKITQMRDKKQDINEKVKITNDVNRRKAVSI